LPSSSLFRMKNPTTPIQISPYRYLDKTRLACIN
jgi:hypothetical protein